jgi:hypothetical protein
MHKAATTTTTTSQLSKLLLVGVASATLAIGAASVASATTEPPTDSAAADVSAFCAAEVAAEQALMSEDPALIGPAVEALVGSAPEDVAPTVEAVIANAEAGPGDPAFDEAYGALIDYVRANCGFNELNVALSEYAFGGIPEEVPAGPTILTAEATGEEVHEIVFFRINDDVTLTLEEILALPEAEQEAMATFAGGMFGIFPGTSQSTVLDLAPGRYAALCFFPEGATPEVFEQMMAAEEAAEGSIPEGSIPADSAAEGSAPTGTEHADMPMDTAPAEGSAPSEGSAPAGEEGTPHFMLGMVQEFTVS